MLGIGIKEIFLGYAGSATYLTVLLLMYVVVGFGYFIAGNNSKGLKIIFGFVFMGFSRLVFLSPILADKPFLPIVSFFVGQVGLYLLMVSSIESGKERFQSLWNGSMIAAGMVSGAILGAASVWISSGGISHAKLLFLAGGFASFGFWAGFLIELRKVSLSNKIIWILGTALFVIAGLFEGLSWAGLLSSNLLWKQFISLADIGGLTFLAICSAGSVRELQNRKENIVKKLKQGKYGKSQMFRNFVGVEGKSVLSEDSSKSYQEIVEAVHEKFGADFVFLRTLKSKGEYFYMRGSAGEVGGKFVSPEMNIPYPKEKYTEHLDDRYRDGRGYKINRDILGGDSNFFVPQSIEWKKDNLFVCPVVEGAATVGVFIIGFFNEISKIDRVFLSLCVGLVAQLIRYERLNDNYYSIEAEISQYKNELENANQLKTNFMSVISHELRTPLTSIKAYAETLTENVFTVKRDTIEDFLKVMSEENERVIALVDNILDYSTMETGQLKCIKETCNVNDILQSVYNDLENKIFASGINCTLRMPKSPVEMDADRELIYQLVNNLMNNALKFTPRKGEIAISLDEEASAIRIVVQDTGKGIPEKQLEKVFERFHQVDNSNTREHGGSGLGLAICKDIVEWHDGRIWVENLKEAGARFVVLLPVRDITVRHSKTTAVIGHTRFNRESFLSLLVEMLAGFLQARKASIMKLDENENVLRVIAAKGMNPEFVENTKVNVGERIAGRVFEEGRAIHIQNIEKDNNFKRSNNSAYYGTHSFISVPLKEKEKVIGVLNVSDHVEGREFTDAEKEVLEALSKIISSMLSKLDAYEVISTNFADLREAMRSILDFRESVGSKNLSLYSKLAVQTGRHLNLDEGSLAAIYVGMNLYDVGMMKIARHIRGKRESLSADEWEKLKKHTDIGYLLLSPMGLDEKIMKMIRSHHESCDGKGYPDGIKSSETSLEVRIISVIDSFRALVTHGPYRRGFSLDEAIAEISKNSGKKFDPEVVKAFLDVLDELRGSEEIQDLEDYFYSKNVDKENQTIAEETEKV
ncbi:GAF domain-containing protein [bacterium]|nr:GAF domain-containing protein [bacterium]